MALCCPKTFTGFCLNDNTPIAITLDNGVIVSWTNLVTGIVTPGNPPAGTGICEVPSIITVEIDPLTCVKDSVTVCQGTNPWVVSGAVSVSNFPASVEVSNDVGNPLPISGTVALDAPTLAALETITVNQGTSPWVVSGTVTVTEPVTVDAVDFDIRNLACGQDAVDACVTFDYPEDSPHVSGDVGAFILAVRNDSGLPLAADGDYIPFTTDATGALRVNSTFSGTVSVALDCATDSVTICPPASGVFDVNVLNFPASVEVSNDVGNPLPVSGTVALDAPTLAALETITVNQGTSPWVVSGTVSITEPITVDAVDFDIRNLNCVTDSVTICPGSTPIATTESSLVPMGYQQIVNPIVSTALTVPPGAIYALMQARTVDISYRDDGVAPTVTVGMRIITDNSIFYTGSLAAVRVISAGGTLDILYYR